MGTHLSGPDPAPTLLNQAASKRATHRLLHDDTANSSLGRVLGVGQCSADVLYRALDGLHDAQPAIERRLARQHLLGSTLVLYDLSSTGLTGRCCELAARGHSRDGKRDAPQIVFGLLCSSEGCPVAVEVFKGNTADPATVATQVTKLKERFGMEHLAWVGDQDLSTLAYNITYTHLNPEARIVTTTRPTPLQARAFKLLGLSPACTQYSTLPANKKFKQGNHLRLVGCQNSDYRYAA